MVLSEISRSFVQTRQVAVKFWAIEYIAAGDLHAVSDVACLVSSFPAAAFCFILFWNIGSLRGQVRRHLPFLLQLPHDTQSI